MKVGTTSDVAMRRASSRLALDWVEGVRLYFNGVVGYAGCDEPPEVGVDEDREDVEVSVELDDSEVSLVDGNAVVEDSADVAEVSLDAVELPEVDELPVDELPVVDGADVGEAAVSPTGSGTAVPAIVVAQPATRTAASAAAAAVHRVRLIDQSFSAEPGRPQTGVPAQP